MDVEDVKQETGVQVQEQPAFKHPGGPFQPGHKKFGGRSKGVPNRRNRLAVEIASNMKVDPVQFLLTVLNSDTVEVAKTDKEGKVILENGKPVMETRPVSLDMKMDAAKAVAPYIHARLQATQVTGVDDGPLAVSLPTQHILADPSMALKLSELALMVAEAQPDEPGN